MPSALSMPCQTIVHAPPAATTPGIAGTVTSRAGAGCPPPRCWAPSAGTRTSVRAYRAYNCGLTAGIIEANDVKRKMYFEFEGAPYHCLDVDISKPTARGGQTLVRIK